MIQQWRGAKAVRILSMHTVHYAVAEGASRHVVVKGAFRLGSHSEGQHHTREIENGWFLLATKLEA
jgi:hypothetical protein